MADLILDGTEYTLPGSTDYGEWLSDTARLQGASWKHAVLIGEHTTTHGIDLTAVRQGVIIDATRLKLTASPSSNLNAIIDLMGATGVRWDGGYIAGGNGNVDCAFFMARDSTGAAAGKHVFNDVEIVGQYQIASVVCVGSESNRWVSPRIENGDTGENYGGMLFADPANYYGSDTAHGGTKATTGTSTNATIENPRFKCKADPYDQSSNPRDAGAITIDGFDRVHVVGQMYANSNLPGLCVMTKTRAVVGPLVDELVWYPVNTNPEEATRWAGPLGNGVVGADIRITRAYINGGRVMTVVGTHATDPGMEFTACTFRHHEDDSATGDMNAIAWDGSTWNHCELRDRFGVSQLDGTAP